VKDRVAIPAADPPDNIMHEQTSQSRFAARIVLLWICND